MYIESLHIKNFKTFKDTSISDLPRFCVFVGANGTGKSSIFSVFAFLQESMQNNVRVALAKLGGSRGFHEVRSRNTEGPIEIEIKFRSDSIKTNSGNSLLITYSLAIDEIKGSPTVTREILKYRRGQRGKPWHFLDFSHGKGYAVINEFDSNVSTEQDLQREEQTLKSPDILAVKGLSQFEKFPAVMALGNLIEKWHLSDFHISKARIEPEIGYAEHLSREGENLALVVEYLYKNHRTVFDNILNQLQHRIPGLNSVSVKETDEGKVLLKFKDGAFADPFLARHVSDGTIKMLAYLVLLNEPEPHSLLCIEEPENQLYPTLLQELAEEFRSYGQRGGQVFVSSHSPDLMNALELEEVFWLVKRNGYSQIERAADNKQIRAFVEEGEKLGYLWKTGCIPGVDPE